MYIYGQDEAIMCNICNRLFISKPAFEVHVAEEHTEDDTKPSEGIYKYFVKQKTTFMDK
jgi:hypothetical protein